jgi:hypothetical protein
MEIKFLDSNFAKGLWTTEEGRSFETEIVFGERIIYVSWNAKQTIEEIVSATYLNPAQYGATDLEVEIDIVADMEGNALILTTEDYNELNNFLLEQEYGN